MLNDSHPSHLSPLRRNLLLFRKISHKSVNDVNTYIELQDQLAYIQPNLFDIHEQTEYRIDNGIPGVQTVCKHIVKKVNNCSVTKRAAEINVEKSHHVAV